MSSPLSFDLNSCLVVLAFGTFLCVADRLISALCFLLFIAISHRFGQGMNMKQILCLRSILEWIDMHDNLMVDDIRWLQHNDLFGKSGSQEKNTFNMSSRFQVLTFSTFFCAKDLWSLPQTICLFAIFQYCASSKIPVRNLVAMASLAVLV